MLRCFGGRVPGVIGGPLHRLPSMCFRQDTTKYQDVGGVPIRAGASTARCVRFAISSRGLLVFNSCERFYMDTDIPDAYLFSKDTYWRMRRPQPETYDDPSPRFAISPTFHGHRLLIPTPQFIGTKIHNAALLFLSHYEQRTRPSRITISRRRAEHMPYQLIGRTQEREARDGETEIVGILLCVLGSRRRREARRVDRVPLSTVQRSCPVVMSSCESDVAELGEWLVMSSWNEIL